MNTETLHAIASTIVHDLSSHKILGKLKQLVASAENRVNNPADASFPKQFDQMVSDLRGVLPKLESNNFPPMWKEYLTELNSSDLIGATLLAEIESVLAANANTPTLVLQDLQNIVGRLEADENALKGIVSASERFNIGKDLPEPDTAEIGILIPRSAVHENLSEFGAELRKLSRIVSVFHEAVHGDRPDVKLKTIASSEFSILCGIDLETAKLIAKSVGNLIEGYKVLIGLKAQIQTLKSAGVPDEALDGIVRHANEQMKTTVHAVSEEIVTNFPDGRIEKSRKKELKIELTGALGEIATRGDKGFGFEIRVGKPAAPKDGEDTPEAQAARAVAETRYNEINAHQSSLRYLKTDGSPILSLPGLTENESNKPEAQKNN